MKYQTSLMIILVLAVTAFGQWNHVPPVAPGDFAIGGAYITGDTELTLTDMWAGNVDFGVELDTTMVFVEYGLPWTGTSVYGGVGMSDGQSEGLGDLSDSATMTTIGLRGCYPLFVAYPGLSLGAVVEVTSFDMDDSWMRNDVDLDVTTITVAPSVQYATGDIAFYAGPYYLHTDGDLDIGKESWDIDEDEDMGVFVGTQLAVMEELTLTVEYRSIGETLVIGGTYAF